MCLRFLQLGCSSEPVICFLFDLLVQIITLKSCYICLTCLKPPKRSEIWDVFLEMACDFPLFCWYLRGNLKRRPNILSSISVLKGTPKKLLAPSPVDSSGLPEVERRAPADSMLLSQKGHLGVAQNETAAVTQVLVHVSTNQGSILGTRFLSHSHLAVRNTPHRGCNKSLSLSHAL